MAVIPNYYQNIIRLDDYTVLCRPDAGASHNYEVLTSYLNARDGELRLDTCD